jgi:hypothetical protein
MRKLLIILAILLMPMQALALSSGLDLSLGQGDYLVQWVNLIPELSLAPATYDYDSHDVGTNTDQIITLANTGNDIAESVTLTVSGTGYGLLSTTCGTNPFDLDFGLDCTATVRFSPASAGTLNGALTASWPNRDDVVTSLTGVGVSTGDVCTGALVASFHFEDTATHNTTLGDPAGCVASGLTATYSLTGGSTYSNVTFSDGANGVNAQGEDDAVEWTHGGADLTEVGTWCGDVYYTGTANGTLSTINITTTAIRGVVNYNAAGSTVQATYGGSNKISTATFPNATWTRLCYSWDESQTGATDLLAVKVGANAWEESIGMTLVDVAQDAIIDPVGGHTFQYGRGFYDNIKIYSDYKHVE